MRDEIIVAGDESDAKRLPSREPRSSPSEPCLDEITIPLPESTGTSDRQTIPPDGDDACKMEPFVAIVADADR